LRGLRVKRAAAGAKVQQIAVTGNQLHPVSFSRSPGMLQ
jgi:hypothetical protein